MVAHKQPSRKHQATLACLQVTFKQHKPAMLCADHMISVRVELRGISGWRRQLPDRHPDLVLLDRRGLHRTMRSCPLGGAG